MTLASLPAAPVRPARVEAFFFRCPIATPVRTSFGTMHDRPAVFVRVEDADGAVGWGEIWCNFPSCGAEHRARLLGRCWRCLPPAVHSAVRRKHSSG